MTVVALESNVPSPRETALDPGWVSDESALLARLRSGDRSAAQRLVDGTYELVYASLFRLTGGDRELAADLTQETYRKAWRALSSFDGRSRLSTWLYRIAYNTFLNHLRRPHPVRALEEHDAEVLPDDGGSGEDSAARHEEGERLRRAVLGLPEELRRVVTARFWGEVPVRDLAREEGITPAAVRKRLKRAYRLLETAVGGADR
jgi:RNA polymerase sigma-70 factor (ECF subfamily)